MSKIGKKPISIPEGVTITRDVDSGRDVLRVKGPKGELIISMLLHVEVDLQDNQIQTSTAKNVKQARSNWGTMSSLISNAVKGVTEGFERKLIFEGVGYKATMKGTDLELNVGYSHPVIYKPAEEITISTEKNTITVNGIDKALVGQAAAEIRKIRKPEPYKGSGIRYADEIIRRKAGKKAVGTTA